MGSCFKSWLLTIDTNGDFSIDDEIQNGRIRKQKFNNEKKSKIVDNYQPIVDGRNPAPVDMVNNPLFTGFHTCQ